jgi:hypothetical protein
MTNGYSHPRGGALVLGLLWAMAVGTGSCTPIKRGSNAGDPGGSPGSGGAVETGGSGSAGAQGNGGNAPGGAGGNGGSPTGGGPGAGGRGGGTGSSAGGTGSAPNGGVTSGGGANGGNGGSGGSGGNGGITGSGGTPPANLPCASNAECTSTGQVCEPATKLCVPCVSTADCQSGGHCLGNRCVTFTPCSSKADCTTLPICDPTRGVCVQCTVDADCGAGRGCSANQCVAVATCKLNTDCTTNVCDTANNKCIDCVGDSDCGAYNKRCLLNVCRTNCTSNADCSALGMICNTSNGACMQCLTSKDCPASWNCLVNKCVPDVCDSTQSACNGTSVAGCSTDGDVFDNYTTCSAGKACTVRGAVATCGGTSTKDGGATDAPPAVGDAGPGSCSGGTMADPCKAGIPKFSGTQTVDGNGSELCGLPYVVLNAQSAAKVLNYNSVPTTQFETATARVGWDAAGLHVYVDVLDTSVQTAAMADATQAVSKAYLGDSIELFLSSSATVTGLTSKDTNTTHLIVPANGAAVSVKDTGSAGTPTALPAAQYAQVATSTGYAIEVSIPWPGSAPSAGSPVRFDMAINSADKTFTGIDKMRDGQLIFYVGTVSGSTTCSTSDGTVPWCDDRTWCQANLL